MVFVRKWSLGLGVVACLIYFAVFYTQAEALGITTSAITFTEVVLNGSKQVVSGSTNAWRVDATGETGGWNVSVSSTDFDNGAGKTIAVSKLEIRLLDANIITISGDPVGPASTQTTYTSLGSEPIRIASSEINLGNGVYDLTPDFRLTIPAQTYAGSYSAIVTVLINTGP